MSLFIHRKTKQQISKARKVKKLTRDHSAGEGSRDSNPGFMIDHFFSNDRCNRKTKMSRCTTLWTNKTLRSKHGKQQKNEEERDKERNFITVAA